MGDILMNIKVPEKLKADKVENVKVSSGEKS